MARKFCPTCLRAFTASRQQPTHCSFVCRFWGKVTVKDVDDCWDWCGQIFTKTGYGCFALIPRQPEVAHRISWKFFHGSIPQNTDSSSWYHGTVIRHTCDNRLCVNPNHLRAGTQTENLQDMAGKGRSPKAVVTSEQIQKIRQDTRLHKLIAKDYGVGRSAISDIKSGRTWSHVK